MSTTDKTRQQLVDSMRKTKAGAAGKTAAGSNSPRPVKKTARTTKKAAATPAAKRSAKTAAGSRPEMRDPYRAGRRVWPD
ncbi:MAG: hypothetical protein WBN08_18980 [Thiogranum sp.]